MLKVFRAFRCMAGLVALLAAFSGSALLADKAAAETLPPPAADTPECAWIGQRVLSLLWRDDINTGRDYMDIYDRFGCPSDHIAPAFRCLVKVGPSAEDSEPGLPERSKACWANPALDPASLRPPVEGADDQNNNGQDQQQDQQGDEQQPTDEGQQKQN